MANTDTVPPVRISGPVSIARLHGRACFDCGAVAKDLSPAGSVRLPGSEQTWPIVTCGCRHGIASRVLELPPLDTVTADQSHGKTGVRGGEELTIETAIALGERLSPLSGTTSPMRWFRRACPECVRRAAGPADAATGIYPDQLDYPTPPPNAENRGARQVTR